MAETAGIPVHWRTLFDERQLKEIDFDCLYADVYHHGTEGHNARLIIAKMARLLDMGEPPDESKPEA